MELMGSGTMTDAVSALLLVWMYHIDTLCGRLVIATYSFNLGVHRMWPCYSCHQMWILLHCF